MQDGLGENKSLIRKLMGDDFARQQTQRGFSSVHPSNRDKILEEIHQKQKEFFERQNEIGEDVFDDEQDTDAIKPNDCQINSSTTDDSESFFEQNLKERETLLDRKAFQSQYMRQQSIIDPSKSNILMDYGIDEFKNSMWENFLGSQVQYSVEEDPDGSYKVTNQNVDKMGPVQLRIEEGNLYHAWEKSRRSEIEGW